jgi:hypothetical protein
VGSAAQSVRLGIGPQRRLSKAIVHRAKGGRRVLLKANTGGGNYGALSLRMEQLVSDSIARRLGRPHFELVDHVAAAAGTSIGAVTVLAQGTGLRTSDLIARLPDLSRRIFAPPGRAGRWKAWAMLRPGYQLEHMRAAIGELLGDRTLADLKLPLLIPVYAIPSQQGQRGIPRGLLVDTISEIDEAGHLKYGDVPIADLATGAAAAQGYFQHHTVGAAPGGALAGMTLQDGGIFLNDPSLALVHSVAAASRQVLSRPLNVADDLVVLTFGTSRDWAGPIAERGLVGRWLGQARGPYDLVMTSPTLIEQAFYGQADAVRASMRAGLGDNYRLLNPQVHAEDLGLQAGQAGFDNPAVIEPLYRFAGSDRLVGQIDETAEWLIDRLELGKPAAHPSDRRRHADRKHTD